MVGLREERKLEGGLEVDMIKVYYTQNGIFRE